MIQGVEGFRDLERRWDDLVADSDHREPFYSWIWFDTWWRHFHRGGELFVVTVADPMGRLQVIAPFMRRRQRFAIRHLGFASNPISPNNRILVRRGFPVSEAVRLVMRCLAEHRDRWDRGRLLNMPETAELVGAMREASESLGFRLHQTDGWQSAYVRLNGGFDEYLASQFRSNRRRGIRQKVRQLSELPGYRLLEFRRPEEMPRALDLAFAVSRASWKQEEGTDMGGADDLRAFYREISERLAERGGVRILVALLDDKPIAVHFYLVSAASVYLIVNDFDHDFRQRSPGTVLLYQSIERLFEERSVYQLCFGGYLFDYKKVWATGVHPHVTIELYHGRPYSRLIGWLKGRFGSRAPGVADPGYYQRQVSGPCSSATETATRDAGDPFQPLIMLDRGPSSAAVAAPIDRRTTALPEDQFS